ncbi:hypothetical protein PVMG_03638 [Plasmodium vivax Mauritania I]|uniref:Variable surface protein Vir4 n=1 Tax=Plasmodium vivax Mauritania I TaxID=1035515 RepID=A0A0J9VXA0_PLAVI|nr:hypothetical protein PVMG_03638 [Plasmodium vivax Mauritania I]
MADSRLFEGLRDYLNIDSVGLTSDSFYRTLNKDEKELNEYYSKCESLLSGKKHFRYKRLCSILLSFLKTSRPLSDKIDFAYDDCILFNYWMYNEIAQRYNYKNPSKVIHAFGDLQGIWNSLISDNLNPDYYNKCKPDFGIATKDDWIERKQLYDYCVNYKSLIATSKTHKDSCKTIYMYIKSNAKLYDHFKERCVPGGKCPNFYSECKNYDPDKVLHLLHCYQDMKEEEASHPAPAAAALSQRAHQGFSRDGKLLSDDLEITCDNSHQVANTGNVLLGVVVTSMTSGVLYKVRSNLVIT